MSSTINTIKPTTGAIWRNGGIAALVATIVNAILYYAGRGIGAFPLDFITPMGQPITIVTVVLMTVVTILGGALLYRLLVRFTANPNRWFIIATIIVFVLFLPGPITLAGAPVSMMIILELMHVVTAGAAIYYLTRK